MTEESIAVSSATHRMRMDLLGRLRNTQVAAQNAFLPIFEAIVNSIHSIEDRFGLEDAAKKGPHSGACVPSPAAPTAEYGRKATC